MLTPFEAVPDLAPAPFTAATTDRLLDEAA
jgi:hypothetical protein